MNNLGGSSFLQALGWAIANSLWQMALLWVFYQCGFLLFRKAKASVKTTSATLFLFGGFLWFVVSLVRHYWELDLHPSLSEQSTPLFSSFVSTPESHPTLLAYANRFLGFGEHYLPYLSFAYLLVLTFLLVRIFKSYRHVWEVRTEGLTKIDPQWRIYIQELAYRIGIRKEVRLWLSEKIDVPATIGYLKPLILIPIASFNQLTTEQVEAILLHELAHIRRHDYLLNLVITVIETILFFNPFAQLITRHIKTERENSCDDFVLQFRYNPHAYASALLSLEKQRMAPELAMAASGKTELLNRIRRILNVPGRPMNYGQKLMAMVITAGILASLAWLTPENVENKPILSSISILMPDQAPVSDVETSTPVAYVAHAAQPAHKCCPGTFHNHCPKMGNQDMEVPAQFLSEDTIKQWEDLTIQNPEMDQVADDNMAVAQPRVTVDPGIRLEIKIDSIARINLEMKKKVDQAMLDEEAQARAAKTQQILAFESQQRAIKLQEILAIEAQHKVQDIQSQINSVTDQIKREVSLNKTSKALYDNRLTELRKLQFQLRFQFPNQTVQPLIQQDSKHQSKVKFTIDQRNVEKVRKILLDSASKVFIQILQSPQGNDSMHVITFNSAKSKPVKFYKVKAKAKVMDQQEEDVDPGIQADQPGWQAPEVQLNQAQRAYTSAIFIPTAYHAKAYDDAVARYAVPSYKERVLYNKGGNAEIHDFLGKLEDLGLMPVSPNVRILRTNGHISINGIGYSEEIGRQFQSFFGGRNFLIYTSGKAIEAYFR
jgi:Zn-dependent protease with chaperone function